MRKTQPNRTMRCLARALCATLLMAGASTSAFAQAADVQSANQLYSPVAANLRSDKVLLPAIASMEPPPKSVEDRRKARLLPAGQAGWDDASAWAAKAPQQAVLTALKSVTSVKEWRKAHAFGLPYGVNGVEPALVRANLYVELGDPPLLAGAKFGYLDGLERLVILVNVEATRLQKDGKPGDALGLLASMLYFARQMVDREFMVESKWGLDTMAHTYERMRDVAYADQLSGAPKLTTENLHDLLGKLNVDDPSTAYVSLERAKVPRADIIATEQLLGHVFGQGGTPDPRTFPSTLARFGSNEHPLRLFSEAGKWQVAMAMQAPYLEQLTRARGLNGDATFRWPLSRFDPSMSRAWEVQKLNKNRFAAAATMPDARPYFASRIITRTEEGGTRTAIGCYGVYLDRKSFPPLVSAIRPQWVKSLDDDPMNPIVSQPGGRGPYGYRIPEAAGLEMTVVVGSEPPFGKLLKSDTFVVYSLGGDHADNKALRVQNIEARPEIPADYLIYPPMLALDREHVFGK